MSKRKRENSSEVKIKKWIAEGRGQGEGPNYKPWLEIQDVASKGYSTRDLGWKTNRVHHFLSDIELNYFYTLEWSPYVIDIREQYPLLPIARTVEIAERIGVEHPRENGKNGPLKVITTDFYLIVRTDKGLKTVVRSIKPVNNLNYRELEKFEIERIFFQENGITDWGIVTDSDIPTNFIRNMEWLYDCKTLNNRSNIDSKNIQKFEPQLYHAVRNENLDLSSLSLKYDEKFGLEYGSCLFIIKHLLANKIWQTNITTKVINPSEKIDIFDKPLNKTDELLGGA